MADATNATHQTDLNTLWKQLDAIFQTKLAKLVEQRDRDKFNQLTAELGFSNTQQELLFDSIGTFMVELASNINLSAPFRHPFAMNRGMVAHAPPPRHAHHTVSHSLLSPIPIASDGHSNASLPALYAIPNNRNESLSTRHKRKRSDMDNDHDTDDDDDDDFDFDEAAEEDQASDDNDDDDYGVSSPPKKKKRRVTRVEELWQPGKDRDLSVKETRDLEKDGIYVIEQITTHRKQGDDGKKLEYKVKWEGYPDETWEPALHLNESLIEDYWRKRGMRSDPALAAQQLQRMEKKKRRKHKKPTAAIGEEEARKQTEQKDDNSNTNNLVKKNKSKRTPKQKQKAKPQSAAASKSASKAKAKSRVKSAKKKRNEPGEGEEEEEDRTESEEEEVALPHCCTQCGKSFKSAAALGGHMAGAHKELYKNGTLSKKTRARKKRKRGKAGGDGDAKRKTPVPFWEDSDDETQLIVIDP
eukprot:CAMPEP_0197031746 /NCGR_PEP_ID=MMETSP1384-20130603/10650_1 /TAXON_ID=29189 /ORGANISM="Ammonia sp." /LENGTH=469 /DNA_ID=CAMNT_0042461317 /DNA_START=20 /DNA_END=1429 /DNA_ORIENTATION=+